MEERIARHADIDTRRAMGFPPRKLPPSIYFFSNREDLSSYVTVLFSRDIRLIKYFNGVFDSYVWVFGRNNHPSKHRVHAMSANGGISIYNGYESQNSRHPDFNQDGSLKSWQSL